MAVPACVAAIVFSHEHRLARTGTGGKAARPPVETGDVIFLPRKQLHSLECASAEPIQLVGAIHPGDNPGINDY